jgi:hypothetical protein
MKKTLVVIGTAITGIGVLFPIIFETSDWGLHYLDTHSFFARWPLMIAAVVLAVISGGLANNWHDYKVKDLSETHAGETTWNPSKAWAVASLIIQLIIIAMME